MINIDNDKTSEDSSAISQNPKQDSTNQDTDAKDLNKKKSDQKDSADQKNWADDLLSIADSQIGYQESRDNYIWEEISERDAQKLLTAGEKDTNVVHDEEDDTWHVRQGYTRYGAWYGDTYADWNAMFVAFCLDYARVPFNQLPTAQDPDDWLNDLVRWDLYMSAAEADANAAADLEEEEIRVPREGDLVFFQNDDRAVDCVGIISQINFETNTLKTIEGDRDHAVRRESYALNDWHVLGFGLLPENPDLTKAEEETETEPESMAVSEEESETETETEPEIESSFEEETETETGTEPEIEANPEEETETEIETDPETEHLEDEESSEPVEETQVDDEPESTNLETSEASDEASDTEGKAIETSEETETTPKTLTATDGAKYLVTVTYGPEACIPDGAELEVSEIRAGTDTFERYEEKTAETLFEAKQRISYARFFDITIVKDDAAVLVAAPVEVQIQLLDAASAETNAQVVHFDESPLNAHPYEVSYEAVEAAPANQEPADSAVAPAEEEPANISAALPQNKPFKSKKISQLLTPAEQPLAATKQEVASPADEEQLTPTYHAVDPTTEVTTSTEPEFIHSSVQDNIIRFTAEGFSVYGIVYTVDFELNGYSYSMPGGSGTVLYYILGGILSILALAALGFRLRKRSRRSSAAK